MTQKVGLVRTTIIGGALFLAPLMVAIFVVGKALALVNKLIAPIAGLFPPTILGFAGVPDLLALCVLIAVCFAAGLVARMSLAKRAVQGIEHRLLSNIPGYEFFKGLGESILGVDQAGSRTVMVHFDDNSQVGFLMEHLADGTSVVFLPGAPNPYSGGVFYVTPDRVQAINVSPQTVLKSLKRLGAGSTELTSVMHRPALVE